MNAFGKLYGVGVGPGDPELLTLKAARVLREADVLCLPRADRARCRAYQIALQALPELAEKDTLALEFPMTDEGEALAAAWEQAFGAVAGRLAAGRTAAFLTIGDPGVYSTYAYLRKRARAAGFPEETVCGVPSFIASAGALGISLCEGNEALHVLSGREDAARALALPGTKVILKGGRRLPELRRQLAELEAEGRAEVFAVSDCGMPQERLYRGAEALPEDGRYMLTVIVKEKHPKSARRHESYAGD